MGEPTKLQEKVGEVGEIGGASIQYTFISGGNPGADSRVGYPAVRPTRALFLTAARSSCISLLTQNRGEPQCLTI